ncbi:MAG: hypothetical protein ACI94Y_004231 [Maribacter sp.]|jgi:hypothetical protein
MKYLIIILALSIFTFSSCQTSQTDTNNDIVDNTIKSAISAIDSIAVDAYGDTSIIARRIAPGTIDVWDLRAEMTKAEFEETQGAELEMLLIRPIYSKIFDLDESDSLVIPQLTEGQKALYFFRKMDDVISEGGVESLMKTELPRKLPTAAQAFRHIDNERLGKMAEKVAMQQKSLTSISANDNGNKNYLNKFDAEYASNQNDFYKKLESYIRAHPEEFIKFTD